MITYLKKKIYIGAGENYSKKEPFGSFHSFYEALDRWVKTPNNFVQKKYSILDLIGILDMRVLCWSVLKCACKLCF